MDPVLYSNIITTHLYSVLSSQVKQNIILDYKGRSLTSEEILKYINAIAIDLIVNNKIKKGDRVVFLTRTSIESILYFFALTRIGAVIILADPEMGQSNFIDRIKFSEARYILQDTILEKIDHFSFIKPILRIFNIWFPNNLPISKNHKVTIHSLSLIKKLTLKDFKEEPLSSDTDLAIIFTSGTTGKPKGVVHSYRSLYAGIKIICDGIPIKSQDYIYASQIYFLLIGLNIPARIYVPKPKKFNAKNFLKTVVKEKITATFLLPYEGQKIFNECSKRNMKIPSYLKTLLFGSAPVTKTFLSRLKNICNSDTFIYGVYGATEMLIISLVSMKDKIEGVNNGDTLGKPLGGLSVVVSEENELLIAGPQMYERYLGDSEKAEYFYSGDLGRIEGDGTITMLGRKKDMIIKKGNNIYPALFESTISSISGIQDCAMVGVYNNNTEDEEIVLYVVKDQGSTITEVELFNALKTGKYSIGRFALPDKIIFIDELPYSGRSKKINKSNLQDMSKKHD